MSLASWLAVLTGPWVTAIATILLVLTSGVLIYGEPDTSWIGWIPRLVSAFSLLVLGANFLSALGLVS